MFKSGIAFQRSVDYDVRLWNRERERHQPKVRLGSKKTTTIAVLHFVFTEYNAHTEQHQHRKSQHPKPQSLVMYTMPAFIHFIC